MTKKYYNILGVSENASDEEIKKAYRELVKKYHPDRYAGSSVADIAGEKLKEINKAYDEIMAMRKNSPQKSAPKQKQNHTDESFEQPRRNTAKETRDYYSKKYNSNAYKSGKSDDDYYKQKQRNISFKTVRALIEKNKLDNAEHILGMLEKTAEWHYLTGIIYMKKGMYQKAYDSMVFAVRLEPDNAEYKKALDNFLKKDKKQNINKNIKKSSISVIDCIKSLCFLDCLCEF